MKPLIIFRNLLPLFFCACVATAPIKKPVSAPAGTAVVHDLSTNEGRHAAFRETKSWKSKIFKDEEVIAIAKPDNIRVQIVLNEQRGYLFVNDLIGYDFPVSTGRKSRPTPTGEYKILVKELKHHSNLYGKIVDAEGNVTNANADITKHVPEEGSTFKGAPMPYFMRLTNDGVGMHIGSLPGYAASHGCIRLPRLVAPKIYAVAQIGTRVSITKNRT